MDEKRLKVTLKVLEAVKIKYPERKDFIEASIEQECLRQKVSAGEVIFLQV